MAHAHIEASYVIIIRSMLLTSILGVAIYTTGIGTTIGNCIK